MKSLKRPFFDETGKYIHGGGPIYIGVPRLTETFNRGLGCYTSGTKDAEKKAKAMGLIPLGNEKIENVFKKEEKDEITPIFEEGIRKLRAKNIKEGKL